MRKSVPHWIRHTYVFDRDRYECSACHQKFYETAMFCPACGARIIGHVDPREQVEESQNEKKD